MASYDLVGFQESAVYQLERRKQGVDFLLPWDVFLSEAKTICQYFKILAVSNLLVDIKPTMFAANLSRASNNWSRLLISGKAQYQQSVKAEVSAQILAPIILRDKPSADAMLTLLGASPIDNGEDYRAFFLSRLMLSIFASGFTQSEQSNIWLNSLEENDEEAFASVMVKSLLAMEELNEKDFWDAFESGLYWREAWVEKKMTMSTTSTLQFVADRFVWFEGLAWLCLAIERGFTLPSQEILYCPDDALKSSTFSAPGDWLLVPIP